MDQLVSTSKSKIKMYVDEEKKVSLEIRRIKEQLETDTSLTPRKKKLLEIFLKENEGHLQEVRRLKEKEIKDVMSVMEDHLKSQGVSYQKLVKSSGKSDGMEYPVLYIAASDAAEAHPLNQLAAGAEDAILTQFIFDPEQIFSQGHNGAYRLGGDIYIDIDSLRYGVPSKTLEHEILHGQHLISIIEGEPLDALAGSILLGGNKYAYGIKAYSKGFALDEIPAHRESVRSALDLAYHNYNGGYGPEVTRALFQEVKTSKTRVEEMVSVLKKIREEAQMLLPTSESVQLTIQNSDETWARAVDLGVAGTYGSGTKKYTYQFTEGNLEGVTISLIPPQKSVFPIDLTKTNSSFMQQLDEAIAIAEGHLEYINQVKYKLDPLKLKEAKGKNIYPELEEIWKSFGQSVNSLNP